MRTIDVTSFTSSSIKTIKEEVSSIYIEDTSFAGGGFGDIYHYVFNEQDPMYSLGINLVVKIFKSFDSPEAIHSWETISLLQNKISSQADKLQDRKLSIIDEYPPLLGFPLFIFEGMLDGKKVRGTVAANLNSLGFLSMEKIIECGDLMNRLYFDLAEEDKYVMCYNLVRTLGFLSKCKFIHADISPDNLFVNIENGVCAIIDFDSGAIIKDIDNSPSTFGKPQEWLAPEVLHNFNGKDGKINVNLDVDVWAVCHAINRILTVMQPYYLKDLSQNSLRVYIENNQWPEIDTSSEIFNKEEYDEAYVNYLAIVKNLPDAIQNRLSVTFSQGVFNPNQRTSYYQWEMTFKNLIPAEARKKNWSTIITQSNPQPIRTYTPNTNNSYKELVFLINDLIIDILLGGESIEHHERFIESMAKKASVNFTSLITDIHDFIDMYNEAIEDRFISRFELANLYNLGKLALIEKATVDKLIGSFDIEG